MKHWRLLVKLCRSSIANSPKIRIIHSPTWDSEPVIIVAQNLNLDAKLFSLCNTTEFVVDGDIITGVGRELELCRYVQI